MTNQRRTWLILLALVVIVGGAIGVDQLSKQSSASAELVALEGDSSDGSGELGSDDYGDMMSLDEDFDEDFDEEISEADLALWEECEAKLDDSSFEELAEDDPCVDLFGDFDGEFGYEGDFADFEGEFVEAGFYDEFGGFEEGYGFDEGDSFGEGYGEDEYYGGGMEDAGWIALTVLGFLLEAAVIGAVAAGVIIWFQRRESAPKAEPKAKK